MDVRVHEDLVSVSGAHGGMVLGRRPRFVEPEDQIAAGSTVATMPGTIVAVAVEVGDTVAAGDVLVVMEAMKMELSVTASMAGVVTSVAVTEGDSVEAGAAIVVVDEIT